MKFLNKTYLILIGASLAFNSCAGLMGMMGGMGSLLGGASGGAMPAINTSSFTGLAGQEESGMMLSESASTDKSGYLLVASASKDLSEKGKLYGLFDVGE